MIDYRDSGNRSASEWQTIVWPGSLGPHAIVRRQAAIPTGRQALKTTAAHFRSQLALRPPVGRPRHGPDHTAPEARPACARRPEFGPPVAGAICGGFALGSADSVFFYLLLLRLQAAPFAVSRALRRRTSAPFQISLTHSLTRLPPADLPQHRARSAGCGSWPACALAFL